MIPSVGCSEVPIDFISKDGGSFFLFPPRMKNSIIESVISKEPKRRRKRRGVGKEKERRLKGKREGERGRERRKRERKERKSGQRKKICLYIAGPLPSLKLPSALQAMKA